jgi:putative addiction module component (TIGR02574 family)
MILDMLPQVKALSREEKCQLMDELWADLSGDPEQSAAIDALLEERYAEFLANPSSGMTLEEFRARIEEGKRVRRDGSQWLFGDVFQNEREK